MAVGEPVDEVGIARPARAGAHGQIAGEVGLGPGGEGSALLVPHGDEFDVGAGANIVGDAVEGITHHTEDALHVGDNEGIDDNLGYGFLGRSGRRLGSTAL